MSSRRGVIAFVLIAFVLGAAVLVAALWTRGRAPALTSGPSVLVFDVPHQLEELEVPFSPLALGRRGSHTTLYEVTRALRHAADDDGIEALVLHVDGLDWGWAKVAEVREAIQAFRDAGKPVYASVTGGGEREYFLASVAHVLSMPPTHTLQLDGLAVSALFLRGAFDKLDVKPNFAHVGRFKSGVETFTRTDLSGPGRAAIEAMLADHWRLLSDSLASARGLSPDSVSRLLENGPFEAMAARTAGLLDTLLYDVELDSMAVEVAEDHVHAVDFDAYAERVSEPRLGERIALVVASGSIMPGRSRDVPGEGVTLGSETVIEALRQARTRRGVRAIVLRVDSPGGHAQASDDIWREVERCREVKPVIVSMSDVAASGGYYFAVAADSLVAQPWTLTGSIGIFGGKLNVSGLYRKLGLNVETVARGPHAEMMSPYRDFKPEEAERYQASLERFYRGFLERVADGRGISVEAADSAGQGRVWTGVAALERGLVDRLGGLETAIGMARARAGIEPSETVVIERFPRVERTFFERFLEDMLRDSNGLGAAVALPPLLDAARAVASFPAGTPLALMPWSFEVR